MLCINNVWLSDKNTDIKTRSSCSGCGACENSCINGAISMQYDVEGFLYPRIDKQKCINCGKCLKVCPIMSLPALQEYLHTYAGYSNELEIINNCASGGICTTISRYAIRHGGVVFGVKYANDFIKTEYSKAETLDELNSFMTSKYVQSTKNKVFILVREELRKGRLVVFIGCPCDVSALYLFLGREYNNLFTCELICMGVTSYKIAQEYIRPRVKRWGKITGFNCKGKKYGWFVPCLEETYSNGKKFSKTFFGTYFGLGFTKFQRPSCSQCPYRGKIGRGDIRVGDFWGIKKSDAFWNPMGVSSIFVRTEKGNQWLQALKGKKFSLFEVPYEKAAINNNMDLSKNYTEMQLGRRKQFANVFFEKGLVTACKKTANCEFLIKHFVPPMFATILKHMKHSITDIRTNKGI